MRLKFVAPLGFCLSLVTVLSAAAAMAQAHPRPKITGISHIAVYASDPKATEHYYVDIIGAVKQPDPENKLGVRYAINTTQSVEVLPLPPNSGINRLDHEAWDTENAEGMRLYLKEKGWTVPTKVTVNADGSKSFRVSDPERNTVEFVQPPSHPQAVNASTAPGHHIIHMGFMVHSRANEDKFYEGLLGFRPYWFGGFKEEKVQWVSQQAPDSHDWLEYMLRDGASDSGIPAGLKQGELGSDDHLSIGVTSVPDSYKMLADGNRLTGHTDAHTQIGRDGKAQFNLYDPDGIRLELMEFHAKEKPCCSPFTAEDPSE